jgi:hypothetical protein
MDRAEHLAWAKQRALEYVDAGDLTSAIASMLSDLGKHPELERSVLAGFIVASTVFDRESARRFVDGFN